MKNKFITYFILFLLLPSYVLAIEPDCPWVLSAIFAKKDLDNIDPSEKIALQNILQNIYKNPKAKISTADLKWIEEYKIQPVVDELIQTANRKNNLESRTKLTGVTRKALTALGLALTAGGLYYLSSSEKEEKKDLKKSEIEWKLTKELNETYGFNLRVESKEDLELLKAILECSPNHRKKPLTQWIYDKDKLPDNIASEIRHGILNGTSLNGLITFLAFGEGYNQSELYKAKELLKKYWQEYHIVFCTSFGTPLHSDSFGHNFKESLDFSKLNPQFLKNNKEPLRIITLTDRKEHGFMVGSPAIESNSYLEGNTIYATNIGKSSRSFPHWTVGYNVGKYVYARLPSDLKSKVDVQLKKWDVSETNWVDYFNKIQGDGRTHASRFYPPINNETKFCLVYANLLQVHQNQEAAIISKPSYYELFYFIKEEFGKQPQGFSK